MEPDYDSRSPSSQTKGFIKHWVVRSNQVCPISLFSPHQIILQKCYASGQNASVSPSYQNCFLKASTKTTFKMSLRIFAKNGFLELTLDLPNQNFQDWDILQAFQETLYTLQRSTSQQNKVKFLGFKYNALHVWLLTTLNFP